MNFEIERKFLIDADLTLIEQNCDNPQHITQGYIVRGETEVRIRVIRSHHGTMHHELTIKRGSGINRAEATLADMLWKEGQLLYELATHEVRKRRYYYDAWDIDLYEDGTIIAEIELQSENAPYDIPEWLNPYVVEEVTGNPEYSNANLAKPRP